MADNNQHVFPAAPLRNALLRIVKEYCEESILLLSHNPTLKQQFANIAKDRLTIHNCLYDKQLMQSKTRWFIGIIACDTASTDIAQLDLVIASLRDIHCERLYLCREKSLDYHKVLEDDKHIRALGLKRISQNHHDEQLYYFDIFDYKEVPTWLNSRFWSNPDMWDKARW